MLERLKKLLVKAAPRPWTAKVEEYPIADTGDADLLLYVRDAQGKGIALVPERYVGSHYTVDGALIAAAINALPALLDLAKAGLEAWHHITCPVWGGGYTEDEDTCISNESRHNCSVCDAWLEFERVLAQLDQK